jgi:hypothetical protein
VVDGENGTYQCSYIPLVDAAAGMWQLAVQIGDVHIAGSPFAVELVAGKEFMFQKGDAVTVNGYSCQGTIRFVGLHKVEPAKGMRVLVELNEPVGKNNGTVGGIQYTSKPLPAKTGVLVSPERVIKVDNGSSSSSEESDLEI